MLWTLHSFTLDRSSICFTALCVKVSLLKLTQGKTLKRLYETQHMIQVTQLLHQNITATLVKQFCNGGVNYITFDE